MRRSWISALKLIALICCKDASPSAYAKKKKDCGLWLGPSLIKEEEQHGFGLGIFTGRKIERGTALGSQLVITLWDWDDTDHPPLREYLWSGDLHLELALEIDHGSLLLFSPGLAAIAPCTSSNFTFARSQGLTFDNANVDRNRDPTAGSFTYHHDVMFRAVRDIAPGEELTVECSDDDFDGAAHSLVRYDPEDDIVTCLDDNLEQGPSLLSKVGQGVFTRRPLEEGSVLTSSPAAPIHQDHLWQEEFRTFQPIINYCFGHVESDLLWLPYGPFVSAINHRSEHPNVALRWHPAPPNDDLARRSQYHHPELLDFSPERVAATHGKGMVVDVVALRPLSKGEELYLDYGDAWERAWRDHERQWPPRGVGGAGDYVPAAVQNRIEAGAKIRTITEQHREPYPANLVTACRYGGDWILDEDAEDYDLVQYHSYNSQQSHRDCLLPCLVLERLEAEEDGKKRTTYTVKLVDQHHENDTIGWLCHIFRRFEYIYEDLPREGIEFVEKTRSSDGFLEGAFRHPPQLPEDMYPRNWRRHGLRRRSQAATEGEWEEEQTYRRRTPIVQDREMMDRKQRANAEL